MASLAQASPDILRPRAAEGWRPGLVLALVAHGLLLVALMFSVQWRTVTPDVVEAEVWSEVPRVATRAVVEPAPSPTPPVLPPTPVVPPTPAQAAESPPPPAPAPVPAPPPPAPAPAEVAVHKQAPRPSKRAPREVFVADTPQVKQRLEHVRPKAPPPPAPEPKPVPKPEPKPVPPPAPVPKPAPVPAPAPVPKPVPVPAPSTALSKQELEKARQDNLKRMMAKLSEDSLQSAGPTAEYAARIKSRVKPNILFSASVAGNPVAVVEVRCAPDGQITARKLLIPSGVAAWDDAVLRAIDRTEVLPRNEQGKVPPSIQLVFSPREF